MNHALPPQGLLAHYSWVQLTASVCWIIIDLIKCNLIISSCVKINTLDSCFICPWRPYRGSRLYLWIGEVWAVHAAVCALPGAVSSGYARTWDASPVPLHLKGCDLAEGCVLASGFRRRKGKPGCSFRNSWFSRSGCNWGPVRSWLPPGCCSRSSR